MLRFDNTPKKATNLSLTVTTLDMARELGLNLSKTVDELLEKEVRRIYRAKWGERNKDAITAYNARVAAEGTFAQQVNEWLAEESGTAAPSAPDQAS